MKKIEIDTLTCGESKLITVDKPGVKLAAGGDLEFKNKLDGDPVATLTFFAMDDKGGTPIDDFCGNGLTSFPVPGTGNGMATCAVTVTGNFEYSITARGHEDLDPVIIIDPQMYSFLPLLGITGAGLAVCGAVLLAATVIAYRMGKAKGKIEPAPGR